MYSDFTFQNIYDICTLLMIRNKYIWWILGAIDWNIFYILCACLIFNITKRIKFNCVQSTTDRDWFNQRCLSDCMREVFTLMDIIKLNLLTSEGVETLCLLDEVLVIIGTLLSMLISKGMLHFVSISKPISFEF